MGQEYRIGLSADITTPPPDRQRMVYTPQQLGGIFETAKNEVIPRAMCRMLGLKQLSDLQMGGLRPEIQAAMRGTRSQMSDISEDESGEEQLVYLIDGFLELQSPTPLDPAAMIAGAREKIALLLTAGAKLGLNEQDGVLMRSIFGTADVRHDLRVVRDEEFYRVLDEAGDTVTKAPHVMFYEDLLRGRT